MAPWIVFLFAGAFDWGFYSYALISAQNAARVAAQYTSLSSANATDSTTACSYVISEMHGVPNVGTSLSTCAALPLIVSATSLVGPDGATAAKVSVTYQTVQLVPIPGLLAGRFTFVTSAIMRVRS